MHYNWKKRVWLKLNSLSFYVQELIRHNTVNVWCKVHQKCAPCIRLHLASSSLIQGALEFAPYIRQTFIYNTFTFYTFFTLNSLNFVKILLHLISKGWRKRRISFCPLFLNELFPKKFIFSFFWLETIIFLSHCATLPEV